MNALTYRTAPAGAILDGVARRVIPLSQAELTAVTMECARMRMARLNRQRRVMPPCTKRWGDLDKYKPKPVGRLTGAFLGLWGLVLVMWEGVTGW